MRYEFQFRFFRQTQSQHFVYGYHSNMARCDGTSRRTRLWKEIERFFKSKHNLLALLKSGESNSELSCPKNASGRDGLRLDPDGDDALH